MEALTIEYALEHKFTENDLVKYFEPSWTDEEANMYLWEETCYPCGDTKTVIEQLNNQFLNKE